jgi:hypothetical protein
MTSKFVWFSPRAAGGVGHYVNDHRSAEKEGMEVIVVAGRPSHVLGSNPLLEKLVFLVRVCLTSFFCLLIWGFRRWLAHPRADAHALGQLLTKKMSS